MKLYLNSNLAEGTPEELVTYKELLKERGLDSEKSLFHFGHMHQPTEDEADEQEVDNSVYDKGAFYTVTEEASESALPVGAILQHLHGRIFSDSKGQQCIISRPSFVERGSTYVLDDSIKQGRFELAKELSIQLTSTTDFAVEASDRTFKFKEDDGVFNKGELVKIVRDDNDRLPLVQSVEDSDKEDFAYIGKLKLVEDTFKGFFGSLMLNKSSIGSTESSTEEDDEADVGEFYTVNVENSALPSGTLLKKVDKDTHKDSTGQEYLCVDSNALSHIDKNLYQLEDRFNFATQVGIRLTDTTDLAQATEGEYFKLTKGYADLSVGDIVTIVRDDRDNMPQCKDKYSNFYYLELHHLEPVEDDEAEVFGTEVYSIFSPEAQTPSRDLKEGDRVKVLNSLGGAVGEATVTAVLEGGQVELAGNNKEGTYLSDWSNYISNVEKIEKPASFGAIQAKAYLEDKSIDQVVEEEQSKYKQESANESVEEEIYDYYEVVDPGLFASSVEKGTVFKVIGNTYTLLNQEGKDRDYINVVTSTGLTQTSPLRDSVIKPIIDDSFIAGRFKFAKEVGINLTVDTDFEEECKDHHFKVTKDEYLSTFNPTDILTVRRDDNTNAIAFQDLNGKAQYTILKHVKEIARPSK